VRVKAEKEKLHRHSELKSKVAVSYINKIVFNNT
jgi:hypothetical protein